MVIVNMSGNHTKMKEYILNVKKGILHQHKLPENSQERRFLSRLKSICNLFDKWDIDRPTNAERLYALQIILNELWNLYELGCKINNNFNKDCHSNNEIRFSDQNAKNCVAEAINDNIVSGLRNRKEDLISYLDKLKNKSDSFKKENIQANSALEWLKDLVKENVERNSIKVGSFICLCFLVRGIHVHEGEASSTGATYIVKKTILFILIDILLVTCYYIASKIKIE